MRTHSLCLCNFALATALTAPGCGGPTPAAEGALADGPAGTCDLDALRGEAQELRTVAAAWTPASGTIHDGSATAASAVWRACGAQMPPRLRRVLDDMAEHPQAPEQTVPLPAEAALLYPDLTSAPAGEVDVLLPGHADVHGVRLDPVQLAELVASVCVDYARVAKAASAMPVAARANAIYDGCDLGPAGVARTFFARHARSPATAVRLIALGRWLEEHGVPKSDVRVFADELLRATRTGAVFEHRLPRSLLLPAGQGTRSPDSAAPALVLHVTGDAILMNGRTVLTLEAGRIPASTQRGELVGAMYDAVAGELDAVRAVVSTADTAPVAAGPHVVLWLFAHRDTPWSTIDGILDGAQRAELSQVVAAVLTDDLDDPVRGHSLYDTPRNQPRPEVGGDPSVQHVLAR